MIKRMEFIVKVLAVVVLVSVFYSYAMFQGGFVSWFLFYSFLPLITYMAVLLCYPISNWQVTRKMGKKMIYAGDEIQVEIEIKRKVGFPIYFLVIEEFFPSSLHHKDSLRNKYKYMDEQEALIENRSMKRVVFPWFKRRIRINYLLKHIPRGEHHVKAIRLKTGDFFGFVKKDYVYPVDSYLLAYPSTRKLSIKEKVNSFDEGGSPSYRVNMKNTNVVSGVREYMPGDRFSWVDWKTTARKNTVMTKEFEQEKSSNVLLVLDAVDYPGLNRISFEGSIELTASVIEAFRRRTAQLSFLALGEDVLYFPMNQDKGQQSLINNFLARLQPTGDVAFAKQLTGQMKKIPGGLMVMIVLTAIDVEKKRAIDQLKQKSKRIIVFLVKPKPAITDVDNDIVHQLRIEGVLVNVLSEQQLLAKEFEVNM
ncbi:DUF58 domain-containing protein [Aquibacillus salsiterrae]|uniref:DUF58 domain-containing protein n=1 Tax=Aquibacillus salsiterrae TaxID=2950439 RepID=A0A9X4AEZ7_9BACI|nr:DUF58 domain-containing protein [Aquibacillus salsiterrae]MDC3417472.1 DUF58 domain-containing protein [Aquibacillus salsiterrae]